MARLSDFEYIVEWVDNFGRVHTEFFVHTDCELMATSYIHKCDNTYVSALRFTRPLEQAKLKYHMEIATREQ